jgi:hypothetical protein
MAAPAFVPQSPVNRATAYESPDYVPGSWAPDRRAELVGRQPAGSELGYQGPDQGFALSIAERFRGRLRLSAGVHADDAIRGCLGIALRRASLYGRAPVVHDLTIAFTVWGFLDPTPPAALVAARRLRFEGVGNPIHGYAHARAIADAIPESTLRSTVDQVAAVYPATWRELVGA